MKLIRALVFPWFAYYLLAIGAVIAVGLKYPKYWHFVQLEAADPRPLYAAALLGAGLALAWNLRTLGNVGIWLSESLPDSLRYGSGKWLSRALKSGLVALAFWALGKLSFMPLIWHAAVIPFVFTVCLFTALSNLIGPILKWSSNLAFSRTFSVILSLPIYAIVPLTALFIGQTFVKAYQASEPELALAMAIAEETEEEKVEAVEVKGRLLSISGQVMRIHSEWPAGSGKKKTLEIDMTALTEDHKNSLPKSPSDKELSFLLSANSIKEAAVQTNPEVLNTDDINAALKSSRPEKRASALRQIYESKGSCGEYGKEILGLLEPKGAKESVYWAIRTLECADLKSVVALPKLAQVMAEHRDPEIRAAAIRALKHYGNENVRQISYLLSKRITPTESSEVIEATAAVLAPLGGDEVRWSANRLKALLSDKESGDAAAKALITEYRRDDLVAEHVGQILSTTEGDHQSVISLICLLPEDKRTVAEPHIEKIVALVKNADQLDPAIKALNCMGKSAFKAIGEEMSRPRQLERPVAARALAELNIRGLPEAIDVANSCARDSNEEVRVHCSQTLGRIGAPALPKILELLSSQEEPLKEAGRTALEFFDDPAAQEELRKIREANSGWMANNAKLEIANAVGTALFKIEKEKASASAEAPPKATN